MTGIALARKAGVSRRTEKGHHFRLTLILLSAAVLAAFFAVYGWDYYILDQGYRPFSPKHAYLKPSGVYGLRLGFLGAGLFFLIYLYPLRKRWAALGRIGKTSHWFDYHITFGLIAPVVITLHSSFKTQGFAGMAYWTMIMLTVSGMIGRYFYAQIPRSIGAAEMSLQEMQALMGKIGRELDAQQILSEAELESAFRLPDSSKVKAMPAVQAIFFMVKLDLLRPFGILRLRKRHAGWIGALLGFVRVGRKRRGKLEHAISLATRQVSMAKRILFLAKTQQVFHLWHVVHRPFSLSLAVFVILHIAIVMWLGYF